MDPEKATTGTPQFQDLIHGHTSARGSAIATDVVAAGTVFDVGGTAVVGDDNALLIDFDADILATVDAAKVTVMEVKVPLELAPGTANGQIKQLADGDLRHLHCDGGLVRRLTKDLGTVGTDRIIKLVFVAAGDVDDPTAEAALELEFAITDNLVQGNVLGSVEGAESWELEANGDLPEISIRVDSSAITAMTRKLKASWTPELAQDLNAYHNLDAEVELTGILSEQIALEIDQEILSDLIAGAQASKLYWSRRPGLFVNRLTGADATSLASPPDFTGSVSEWYETLVETINDVSADIHRKTLRGGANFLVCGPEVANILEFTSGFRASVTHDDATGSVGAVQIGSINKKWDLHVDPYFPRNAILVGRKGASFLESGYVYAPYVPLQVTPTIFDTADFTPRKAVMTRYGKKMVRPDMYGLVICRDLEG